MLRLSRAAEGERELVGALEWRAGTGQAQKHLPLPHVRVHVVFPHNSHRNIPSPLLNAHLPSTPTTVGYLSTNKSEATNFPEWQIKERTKILWVNAA